MFLSSSFYQIKRILFFFIAFVFYYRNIDNMLYTKTLYIFTTTRYPSSTHRKLNNFFLLFLLFLFFLFDIIIVIIIIMSLTLHCYLCRKKMLRHFIIEKFYNQFEKETEFWSIQISGMKRQRQSRITVWNSLELRRKLICLRMSATKDLSDTAVLAERLKKPRRLMSNTDDFITESYTKFRIL